MHGAPRLLREEPLEVSGLRTETIEVLELRAQGGRIVAAAREEQHGLGDCTLSVPASLQLRDDRRGVGSADDPFVGERVEGLAEMDERLGHRAPGRRRRVEERHLVVLEVVLRGEPRIDAPEAPHAEQGHLARANGAHRGETPHLPAPVEGLAELGVTDGELLVEDPVDDGDDTRPPAASDDLRDIQSLHRRQEAHAGREAGFPRDRPERRPDEEEDVRRVWHDDPPGRGAARPGPATR